MCRVSGANTIFCHHPLSVAFLPLPAQARSRRRPQLLPAHTRQRAGSGTMGYLRPLPPVRCARLELRSHPWRASSPPAAEWRMGRDWSPGATCLTARTAFFIPPRSFKRLTAEWRMGRDSNPRCIAAHTLSKRAHSTTLPPILEQGELNTTVGRAARRQQAFARLAVQALMAVMEGGQCCFRVRFTV